MCFFYNCADKTQEFIDENGQPVKDCVLCLSLKNFICQKAQRLMEDFEDVQLTITSEMLADFYKEVFAIGHKCLP
jgi:Zn-finger protein